MTDQPPKKSFAEMRRELAEKRGRPLPEKKTERPLTVVPKVDEDLIPDVLGERTEEDLQIDGIIESIDVVDAYRKWIGKEVDEKTTNRTEGVMVSCPIPGHRDADPSAWINTKKRSWFCGGCQEGGDLYDLAAIKFGYDRPGYKDGKLFHDLRKEMAESYGYRFKTVAGTEVIWRDEEPATPEADPVPQPADDAGAKAGQPDGELESTDATITTLHDKDIEDALEEEIDYPTLDWRSIVKEDTFLYEYCAATSNDDSPEEYHFWHGVLALGHAAGRKAFLDDTRPVYGNLLVCLLGGTGFRKSGSRGWLDVVVEESMPYRDTGLGTTGVKLVPVPASGESLIRQFQHIASDPSLPKGTEIRTPVNGIVDYDEFASLLSRASRQGSTLKPIIMGFSDTRSRVNTSSLTSGTLEAEKPFCSITASTQPKAVRPLLSRTDTSSGFLNRWLFVAGRRKEREVIGGQRSRIRVDLTASIDLLKKIHGWAGIEREVTFTDDGHTEFVRFVNKEVWPAQDRDDSDLLTRLDLTMKRLILLFCINEKRVQADAELVKRVEPVLEYLIKCYAILNNEIGVTAMTEITTDILRHIKNIEEKTGRGATARDLGLRMKRKYSPDLIDKALKTMQSLDWIDAEKNKGPGRPSIRYKAVK